MKISYLIFLFPIILITYCQTSEDLIVSSPITDQLLILERSYKYEIPYNTFFSSHTNLFTYKVTLEDGSILPWIEYSTLPQKRFDALSVFGNYIDKSKEHDARKVTVINNIAYVADRNQGLLIIDVSNPSFPSLLGSYNCSANDVVIYNTLAYIASDFGLYIINVINPTSPSLLANYKTSIARGIFVNNEIAYVASSKLLIIDVSNPYSPSLLGDYNIGIANGVVVVNNIAYIADLLSGLKIIDVSNPHFPSFLGSYSTPGSAHRVAVTHNIAYVADGSKGLQILNVSNPESPSLITNFYEYCNTNDVFIVNNIAYVVYAGGLVVIDVRNPYRPSLVTRHHTRGYAYGINVVNNIAYVTSSTSGLLILSLLYLFSPFALLQNYYTSYQIINVDVVDDIAYLVGGSELEILNVSNSFDPILLGSYNFSSPVYRVTVSDNIAYVCNVAKGLQILNVSNPSSPSFLGNYTEAKSRVLGVVVVDNIAYIADQYYGLMIINVSNPSSPSLLGVFDDLVAVDINVVNSIAYIAAGEGGLQIISVSDPSSPSLLGSYEDLLINSLGIIVVNNIAYIADYMTGFKIIDVSQPNNPIFLGDYYLEDASGITFVDNIVYIACGAKGLYFFNVNNPYYPILLGIYSTPGDTNGIAVVDNIIYLSDTSSGLLILGIINTLSLHGFISYTSTFVYNITVSASFRTISVNDTFSLRITGIRARNCYSYFEDTPFVFPDILLLGIGKNGSLNIELDSGMGILNEASSGKISSTFDKSLGLWHVDGVISDINVILSSLTFTPVSNCYSSSFNISFFYRDTSDAYPDVISKVISMSCIKKTPSFLDFIVSIIPFASAIIILFVLLYFLLEYYKKQKNIEHHDSTIIFFCLLTVYDFFTDIIFTISISYYTTLFIIGLAAIIVSFIINIFILFHFIMNQILYNSDFKEWFVHNSTKLSFVFLLASTNLSISKLIVSNLLGIQMFSAPISVEDKYKLDSYSIITQFTENIPQLFLQLYIAFSIDYIDWPPILVFSLIGSSLMIIFGLISRVLSWIFVYSSVKLKKNEIERRGVQLGEFSEDNSPSFSAFSSSLK